MFYVRGRTERGTDGTEPNGSSKHSTHGGVRSHAQQEPQNAERKTAPSRASAVPRDPRRGRAHAQTGPARRAFRSFPATRTGPVSSRHGSRTHRMVRFVSSIDYDIADVYNGPLMRSSR